MTGLQKYVIALLIVIACGYLALDWFVTDQVTKGVRQAVGEVSGLEVTYEDINVDLVSRTVAVIGVNATLPDGSRVTADSILFSDLDQKHETPLHAKVSATNLSMDIMAAPTWLASTMRRIGQQKLTGNCTLDYQFDTGNNALNVKKLKMDMPALADIDLSIKLDNVKPEHFFKGNLVGAMIGKGGLEFTDKGLVDLLIEAYMGPDAQIGRAALAREIETTIATDMDADAATKKSLSAIRTFLAKPKASIALSTAPEKPVPWLYFFMGRSLAQNVKALKLDATTVVISN